MSSSWKWMAPYCSGAFRQFISEPSQLKPVMARAGRLTVSPESRLGERSAMAVPEMSQEKSQSATASSPRPDGTTLPASWAMPARSSATRARRGRSILAVKSPADKSPPPGGRRRCLAHEPGGEQEGACRNRRAEPGLGRHADGGGGGEALVGERFLVEHDLAAAGIEARRHQVPFPLDEGFAGVEAKHLAAVAEAELEATLLVDAEPVARSVGLGPASHDRLPALVRGRRPDHRLQRRALGPV